MNIKFRGKCLKSGDWYYGGYAECFFDGGYVSSIVVDGDDGFKHIAVSKESVGQFTGHYDKNGKEIYSGDNLEFEYLGVTCNRVVVFNNGCFLADDGHDNENFEFLDDYDYKIIGNIHE